MPLPKTKPPRRAPSQPVKFEAVDPIWLLKAIGLAMAAALICGYLALCLLFYQGQWQLVLHPARTESSPAALAGVPYELIRFAPDESALPQLSGWWIPADPAARYRQFTVLFLPGADGSLMNSIATLAALHNIGINIFAFDYRGYGQSAAMHPSERSMTEDAGCAWEYLNASRGIPGQQIIPYGVNVGASLAARMAANHNAAPALILDSPHADLLGAAQRDIRSHLIPVRLLFHERFPLAHPLSTLRTPKLLISRSQSADPAFEAAAGPKVSVELRSDSEATYRQILERFLGQYLPATGVSQLAPTPAPAQ